MGTKNTKLSNYNHHTFWTKNQKAINKSDKGKIKPFQVTQTNQVRTNRNITFPLDIGSKPSKRFTG